MDLTSYLPPDWIWVLWLVGGAVAVTATWLLTRSLISGVRALWKRRQSASRDATRATAVEDGLTWAVATIATGVSAEGMWRFTGDVLRLEGLLQIALFAFIELSMVTEAVRARRNMREHGSAGLDGIAVWALACLTAVLSSMDAREPAEAIFRLAAPLVAAWMWERGMRLERHRMRGTTGINWRITPERILVRIGLAEVSDRTASEVDAHRRLTRVALAAKRAKLLKESDASKRKLRRALAKLDKRLDQAVEHTGLARDKKMQWALLDQMTTLRGSASLMELPDVAPWQQLDHPAITGERHKEAARLAEETRRLADAVLAERDPEAAATIEMLSAMITGQRLPLAGGGTERPVSPRVADLVASRVPVLPSPQPARDTPSGTFSDTQSDTSTRVPEQVSEEVSDEEVDAIIRRLRDEEADAASDTGDDTGTATPSATQAMRRHWDEAIAQGRVPSGVELAEAGGCVESYGRRMRREWLDALDGRTRRRLLGPKKVTA